MPLIIFLIGLVLSIAPIALSVIYNLAIPTGVTIASVFVGVLLIVLAAIMGAINNYYVKPVPNQVLVRTGQGGIKVIKDEGGWVIPVLHKTKPVSLENGI